jgi:hypothetical protein
MAETFTLSLELRDGSPVMILNGTELSPAEAERLQHQLGIVVRGLGDGAPIPIPRRLAGQDGRTRETAEERRRPGRPRAAVTEAA